MTNWLLPEKSKLLGAMKSLVDRPVADSQRQSKAKDARLP